MSKRTINLDVIRAARAEAAEEPIELVFGDEVIPLPVDFPVAVLVAFGRMQGDEEDGSGGDMSGLEDGLSALVGVDVATKLLTEYRIGAFELLDLLTAAAELYGISLGESSASAPSSSNGGKPSRPTSPGTTKRTSASRSSAPTPSLPAPGASEPS
jgi:hypothetical protein